MCKKPALFGIDNSNRDFTQKESWGKNRFNSSFPASLVCYMAYKGLDLKYLTLSCKGEVVHKFIKPNDFLGMKYDDPDLFFSFESDYLPYQKLIVNNLPRIDLVTLNRKNGNCLKGIEVKLTALPDQTTFSFAENKYGCEIVIRPSTVVYMALSIIMATKENRDYLRSVFNSLSCIDDWQQGENIISSLKTMGKMIESVLLKYEANQTPLILQPIWKTLGKSQVLSDNAFDVFVWSDFAATQLFLNVAKQELTQNSSKITRQARSIVWLTKMLFDYAISGKIDHKKIIDELSYNTKNDKAFAVSGIITHPFMDSVQLHVPRIKKTELKNIILGGGQKMLSPERRLDSVILSNISLFED
jgi:hypothetical protein